MSVCANQQPRGGEEGVQVRGVSKCVCVNGCELVCVCVCVCAGETAESVAPGPSEIISSISHAVREMQPASTCCP